MTPPGGGAPLHVWLRSGRVFTMSARSWGDRTAAHRWAAVRRPDKADRLVLGCSELSGVEALEAAGAAVGGYRPGGRGSPGRGGR